MQNAPPVLGVADRVAVRAPRVVIMMSVTLTVVAV